MVWARGVFLNSLGSEMRPQSGARMCFLHNETMVFEGFTVSSEDGISNIVRCLGTSFSEVLGYLGCHFECILGDVEEA